MSVRMTQQSVGRTAQARAFQEGSELVAVEVNNQPRSTVDKLSVSESERRLCTRLQARKPGVVRSERPS